MAILGKAYSLSPAEPSKQTNKWSFPKWMLNKNRHSIEDIWILLGLSIYPCYISGNKYKKMIGFDKVERSDSASSTCLP